MTKKLLLLCLIHTISTAQAQDLNQINQQQNNQYQQQLEQYAKEHLENQPPIHLKQTTNQPLEIQNITTNENPCFIINDIKLTHQSTDPINNLATRHFKHTTDQLTHGKNNILGKCIGQTGLRQINNHIQNQLLTQGYITTTATIPQQDLNDGVLEIRIIPGKIKQIKNDENNATSTSLFNAIVSRPNDILNLKDIETSLENYRRPQSVETNIDIVPSTDTANNTANNADNAEFGYSDLIIHQQRHNPLSFQLSIDDSGNQDTGKYQGTVTSTIDNPLNSNDILNISYTHSIDPWNNPTTDSNNNNLYISYQYPFRKSQLKLNHSRYNFQQTLAGLNEDIIYRGKTTQNRVTLEHLLHRDQQSKTTISLGGYHKQSKNYFDDEEIEVQRKRTSGWTANLSHQRETDFGSINASLGYEKGTGAFSAIPAPETFVSNAEAHPSITTANIGLIAPFQIGRGDYQYKLNWRGQYSKDELTSQDLFAIGGRYSIKGSSDQASLSGETGMLWQQEMARSFPLKNNVTLQPYVTLDQGVVNGVSTEYLAGKKIIASSFGLRVYSANLTLDGFIGKAIKTPIKEDTKANAGFKVNFYF